MQAKTVMGGCYVSLSSVAAPALPNSLTSLTPTNNTCNNKSTDTRFRRHSFDKRGYKTITSPPLHPKKLDPSNLEADINKVQAKPTTNVLRNVHENPDRKV